jgi:hypothetical protein
MRGLTPRVVSAARSFYERLGWAWDGTIAPHDVGGQEHPVVRYRRSL